MMIDIDTQIRDDHVRNVFIRNFKVSCDEIFLFSSFVTVKFSITNMNKKWSLYLIKKHFKWQVKCQSWRCTLSLGQNLLNSLLMYMFNYFVEKPYKTFFPIWFMIKEAQTHKFLVITGFEHSLLSSRRRLVDGTYNKTTKMFTHFMKRWAHESKLEQREREWERNEKC